MSLSAKGQYSRQITIRFTESAFHLLETLANRQKTSIGDLVRRAVHDYLDEQDDVLGSRSRTGSRIARQMEEMQGRYLQQQTHATVLLLAAIIVTQMRQGAEGSEVLKQIAQITAHAGDEIKAVVEATP